MKPKLIFLIILIGFIGGAFLLLKVLNSRSPKQGELRVDSTPVVSVFLDNKHLGRTPLREKVQAGEYTLKLVPETTTQPLSAWQGKITVGANLLTYINSNLSESELSSAVDLLWLEKISGKKSELSVLTNPDGANVLLDDETKGMTPLTISDVTAGEHSLTVSSPGFLTRNLKIKATEGYKLIASLKLALSSLGVVTEATSSPSPTPTGSVEAASTSKPTPRPTSALPDPAKPFVIIKDTPTGYLRVRLEPSTSASEAARVKPGEKYTILESQNGWYEIKYDGVNAGWISGQYAEKVE